jgi:hypothetical protein
LTMPTDIQSSSPAGASSTGFIAIAYHYRSYGRAAEKSVDDASIPCF